MIKTEIKPTSQEIMEIGIAHNEVITAKAHKDTCAQEQAVIKLANLLTQTPGAIDVYIASATKEGR